MFGKSKDFIFLLSQDVILNNDEEKELKNNIFLYMNKEINSLFKKRKIKYVDYFSSRNNNKIYSYFLTFLPEEKELFKPFLYELYAFTCEEKIEIFKDYEVEEKLFFNENQEIKLYKIKI